MEHTSALQDAKIGDFVQVRGKEWLVEEVSDAEDLPILTLACISDDSQGEELKVLPAVEVDSSIISENNWKQIGQKSPDNAKVLAAYIRTLRWKSATAADRKLFQSPFRAGIRLDTYQLLPLQKALNLPRVNLLIADDVGLGKTVEAGLIVRELLLRRKLDYILVSAPPSMTNQWKDELESKFGLTFDILDRERLRELRRMRGYSVNPWTTGSKFIISHRLLNDETYVSGLRDVLGSFRAKSIFVLDEAHHAAPVGATDGSGKKNSSVYAVSSQLTKAVRELTNRFEHRLFLTATPHNGHSNSFSSLLEMLDPQRFTRGVKVQPSDLEPIMIRRLKSDLRKLGESFPERIIEPIIIKKLPIDAPELVLAEKLAEYGDIRQKRLSRLPAGKIASAHLVLVGLQRRLLSSVNTFSLSLERHKKTLEKLRDGKLKFDATGASAFTDPPTADDTAELEFDEESAEESSEQDDIECTESATKSGSIDSTNEEFEAEISAVEEMLAIAKPFQSRPDAKLAKLIEIIRQDYLVDDTNWKNERLIVFTEWEDTRRYLEKRLRETIANTDDAENRISTFTGATGSVKREKVIRAFNTNPEIEPLRILICTDAAREGINLQSYCSQLIHFDLPWNPSRLEQRNGRIDRKLQPAQRVFCRYFIYEQRKADIVLDALVKKTKNIHEELGSMGQVIENRITQTLLEKGIENGKEERLAQDIMNENDIEKYAVAREEMDDEDSKRLTRIKKDMEGLRVRLEDSEKKVGVNSNDLKQVVAVVFEQNGTNFESKKADRIGDTDTYILDPAESIFQKDAGWGHVFDDLRNRPRAKKESLNKWRQESEIRQIAFESAKLEDGRIPENVVQLHVEHRLVRRLLSRFISQGFQSSLSRLSVIMGPGAQPRVILLGRLALYGPSAVRLHEEIIPVTAIWSDVNRKQKHLRPLGESGEGTTLNQLEEALKTAKDAPKAIVQRIKSFLEQDIAELTPTLEDLSMKNIASAKTKLSKAGQEEADSLKKLLENQKARIQKEEEKYTQNQGSLFELIPSERKEREADQRHWKTRLENIEKEISEEPPRLKESFIVKSTRIDPVGIVYLWPETG